MPNRYFATGLIRAGSIVFVDPAVRQSLPLRTSSDW